MNSTVVKAVTLGLGSVLLIGCGSSGSEETSPGDFVGDLEDTIDVIVDNQEGVSTNLSVSDKQYVSLASSIYAELSADVYRAQLQVESAIIDLKMATEPGTEVNPCYSGQTTEVYFLPLEDETGNELNVGDSFEKTYQDCKRYSFSQLVSGTESLSILPLMSYHDSERQNSIHFDFNSELTKTGSSGSETYHRYLFNGISVYQPYGDFGYFGVNIEGVYYGTTPDTASPVADSIEYILENPSPQATSYVFETTNVNYDRFAYEVINGEEITLDFDMIEYEMRQWHIDANYKQDSSRDYTSETLEQLVIKEQLVVDEDGYSDYEPVAVSGKFMITVTATGDIIHVEILKETDGATIGVSPPGNKNVKIGLDKNGDGSVDASHTMSWNNFEFALYYVI